MKVAKEETFAPLAPVFKFDTEEQVIQMAVSLQNLGRHLTIFPHAKILVEFGVSSRSFRIWFSYTMSGLITNESVPSGGAERQSGLGRKVRNMVWMNF